MPQTDHCCHNYGNQLIVFERKIGYNSAYTRDGAENLAPNRKFVTSAI